MEKYVNYKKGDQVACIPSHADGDIRHESVEFGFVTKDHGDDCWVRYFYKDDGDMDGRPPLRTVANSERTPKWMLRKHYFALPAYIEEVLERIEADNVSQG